MEKYEQERFAKLQKLREKGIDPFGGRYDNVQSIQSILESYSPECDDLKVKAAGRIMTMRPHGKTVFLDPGLDGKNTGIYQTR